MAKFKKEWFEEGAVGTNEFKAENNQFIKGRNAADDANIDILKVNASDELEFATTPKVGANALLDESQKGAVNGLASLDGSGLVPSAQLPSFVDDVLEFADLASFPGTGEVGKIYVALDTNKTYRWSGSTYVEINAGPANTDALAEGSTNLYFTVARARLAAVVNSMAGSESDQAPSVVAVQAYVASQISGITVNARNQIRTLTNAEFTTKNITLPEAPIAGSLHITPEGGPPQALGTDFTVSGTTLTLTGDLALYAAEGSRLIIHYLY